MLKKILCLLLVFSFSTGVINFTDCNLYALESRSVEYYNTVTKPYSNYMIPGYGQDYICFQITAKIRYFVTSNGSVTPYLQSYSIHDVGSVGPNNSRITATISSSSPSKGGVIRNNKISFTINVSMNGGDTIAGTIHTDFVLNE